MFVGSACLEIWLLILITVCLLCDTVVDGPHLVPRFGVQNFISTFLSFHLFFLL